MQYNFTDIIDRHGWDALSVDSLGMMPGMSPDPPQDGFSFLPMWIADMNFATVPTIPAAICQRAEHALYGYFRPSAEYFQAIRYWQASRLGVNDLEDRHIGYENGVLGGLVSALNIFCSRGDEVLVHSPVYVGFSSTLTNNGYRLLASPLVQDTAGVWRMDMADMEEKLATHHVHTAIVCNPHNPCGRAWTAEELREMMDLFEKYKVNVISDEIWADLILKGKHTPTQSVSDYARQHTVAEYAPSKTFNMAGLAGSYHIIYNDVLHERVRKEAAMTHYNNMNTLWMHALLGAYCPEGAAWCDELLTVLRQNVHLAWEHITAHYPGIHTVLPEATYMLFLDCREYCESHGKSLPELLKAGWNVGVGWQDGRPFGNPYGIRLNLALPTSLVEEALRRLDRYVFID